MSSAPHGKKNHRSTTRSPLSFQNGLSSTRQESSLTGSNCSDTGREVHCRGRRASVPMVSVPNSGRRQWGRRKSEPSITTRPFDVRSNVSWPITPQTTSTIPSPGQPISSGPTDPDELKGKLRRKFFVVLATVLVLALVSVHVMAAFLPSTKPARYACTSRRCRALNASMDHVLFRKSDPCRDFYTYVCGRWSTSHTSTSSFARDHRRLAKQLLHGQLEKTTSRAFRPMTAFYNSCYSHLRTRKTLSTITEGVFDALHLSWTSWATRPLRAIVPTLVDIAFKHGLYSVFFADIQLDNPDRFVLGTGSPLRDKTGAASPTDDDAFLYAESMIRAIDRTFRVTDLASKVKRLDDVVFDVMHRGGKEVTRLVQLKHLNFGEVPNVVWISSIKRNAPQRLKSSVQPSTKVLVKGEKVLKIVFDVLENTSSDIRSLYLLLLLTSNVIRNEFYDRYVNADVFQRSVTCSELLSRFFPDHYPQVEASLFENTDARTRMAEFFRAAKNVVMKEVSQISWMDSKSKRATLSLMDRVSLTSYFSASKQDHSASMRFWGHNFLENLLVANSDLRKRRLEAGSLFNYTQYNLSHLQWLGTISYVREVHSIIVPSQNFMEPMLYHRSEDDFQNYGAIVTILLRGLLTPFKNDAWTSSVSFTYENKTQCLNGSLQTPLSGPQTEEAYMLTVSLRLAYGLSLERFSLELLHVAERVAAIRVFFQRYCLMLCSHPSLEMRTTMELRRRDKCHLPLRHMPGFARAYECPKKSYMQQGRICADLRSPDSFVE